MSLFTKTISPPIAAPAETGQDKLTKLRAELAEAERQHTIASNTYFSELQRVAAEPPAYFWAAVDRHAAHVRQLQIAVAAAEQDLARATAKNRRAVSASAVPEYKQHLVRVVAALRELGASLAGVREFRAELDATDSYDPNILVPFFLAELEDDDRLNGAISLIETIAGQNGRLE
jgi:hypothetical protein